MVFRLTKITHFVPCHKEITSKDPAYVFISSCYRLHGIPIVIVSVRDPKFVGKCWQSFMRKLNNTLNMNIAPHPRTHGLAERVNQTMQRLFRY